jgi:putative spermidine/putrescine transport system substrate-binding protein
MRFTRFSCAAALVLALGACGGGNGATGKQAEAPRLAAQQSIGASEKLLNLVVWAGYAEDGSTPGAKDKDWVHPFEKKTGCRVSAKVADTSDSMVALMQSGQYDGVSASGDASLRLIYGGTVAPVNTNLLRNYGDISSYLKNQPYNSVKGQMYGMPHGYGANFLTYRTDKLPEPSSWSVIWDKRSPAADHIVDYDSPIFMADAALYLKAHRPDLKITDVYELTRPQFNAAVNLLKQQRSNVNQYWSNYLDEIEAFKAGDNYAGTAWFVTAHEANGRRSLKSPKSLINAVIPQEGATGWSDTWMISSRAKHPNCMYKWMNWISTPKIQAEVGQYFGEAPANPKACAYIPATNKSFCDDFSVGKIEFYKRLAFWKTPVADCGDSRGTTCVDYSEWTQLWTQIKG